MNEDMKIVLQTVVFITVTVSMAIMGTLAIIRVFPY